MITKQIKFYKICQIFTKPFNYTLKIITDSNEDVATIEENKKNCYLEWRTFLIDYKMP